MSEPTTSYVLFIKVANDPPRVKVFDTLGEAEVCLDTFEDEMFVRIDCLAHNFRIFEYKGAGWGAEIDVQELRRRMHAETSQLEWEEMLGSLHSEAGRRRLVARIDIPYLNAAARVT